MSLLLVLPVLLPLATAAALLLTPAGAARARLGVTGALAQLVAAGALLHRVMTDGLLVLQAGSWPAPFGVALVADHFAALVLLAAAAVALAALVFSVDELRGEPWAARLYPVAHLLLAGVSGALLAGDLFNLYVWFEVMLVASFVLVTLPGGAAQLDAGIKYVAVNLVASLLLLSAVGILYGLTGTLNLADMAVGLGALESGGAVRAVAMLCIIAFGIKAALFPVFAWLTVSYHTVPVCISALFAGLLTKVGVYGLVRVSTLLFPQEAGYTHPILLVVAGYTMVGGVLAAAAQGDVRRILSVHIVSQIGYIVMALALGTPLALAGAVFYTVHIMLVKSNLLLLGGVMHRVGGSFDLKRLGGLRRAHPLLAALFLLSALSLAGVPPLSGFWAKLLVVRAGLEGGAFLAAAAALLVGLGTLFSMVKIWSLAYWGAAPPPGTAGGAGASMLVPVLALTGLTVALGLWAEPLLALSHRAAGELLDPAAYVRAVLGPRG